MAPSTWSPRSSPTNSSAARKRLLGLRHKQARFRDPDRSLDGLDFTFNKKISRALALTRVDLLIIDNLCMRKLPHAAVEDALELVMRRYDRASTILASNRPIENWAMLLGDSAAVTALLDRLLYQAHVLKCGPGSWCTGSRPLRQHNDAVK